MWLFEVCPGAKCSALRKIIHDDVSCTKVLVSSTSCLTDTDNFVSSLFQCDDDAPSSDWLPRLIGVSFFVRVCFEQLPELVHLRVLLAFFLSEKNTLASINWHSKNFITRAFPLLMSRRLSKCERLTATLAQTSLKLLKVMTR